MSTDGLYKENAYTPSLAVITVVVESCF